MGETRLLFSSSISGRGNELWITAGGDATRLTDLNPGGASSTPEVLGQVGKWVYFSADNGDGRDLYRLDTLTMKVVAVGPANSNPTWVAGVNGAIYLSMDNGTDGRELWVATAGAVTMTGDSYLEGSLSPSAGVGLGTSAIFAGSDEDKGTELFISRGGGTPVLLKDINPLGNSNPGDVGGFHAFGSKVLFDANDGTGAQLWITNGSAASKLSTVEIPQNFFTYDNGINERVLFSGQTPGGFSKYLYITDGTSGGTQRVTTSVLEPYGFTLYKGKVYFSGYSSAYGRELWVTDGTAGGTELAVDLDYSPASSGASNLLVLNGKLLFTDNEQSLWWTDGSFDDAHQIRDFGSVGNFAVMGTKAYFVAYTSSGGYQIWSTDGTTATATNLVPGQNLPQALQALIITGGSNKASEFADLLTGSSANNKYDGKAGNDTIDGGSGNDTLIGGDGRDLLTGGAGDDSVTGGTGHDTLSGSSGQDSLIGGDGNDSLNGGGDNDTLKGGNNNDRLNGSTGNDSLYGDAGNDTLAGSDGNDTLRGGAGNDLLTGGAGKDQFRFDTTPNTIGNFDRVTDFTIRTDKIALDDAIYLVGTSLTADEFLSRASGHTATTALQHIVYDRATGELWLDVDGKGGEDAVKFAVLDTRPAGLSVGDFTIV